MHESKPFNRVELNPKETEAALKKAELLLSTKFPRIDETSFENLFGEKRVREAIEVTASIDSHFNNTGLEKEVARGTIFEALVLDLFQNFWFDTLNMKRASKTDDYINKVDTILTKKSNSSVSAMALSMDPTTSVASLTKKAKHINANRGLTNIDFCEIGNFRGRLEGVPHVALYVNDEIFTQIVRLWLNADSKIFVKNSLKYHPIQLIFLTQIIHQLNLIIKQIQAQVILTESERHSLSFALDYQKTSQIILSVKKQEIEKYMKERGENLKDILSTPTYLQSIEIVKALFV